jgi:hypothetical protein
MRRIAPAAALFLLAPLVAEFLLGDLPLTYLAALVILAPMYGGGALLIRELTRRTGRGWPTMLILALAYGVLEEGITTQSLFDPDYAHAHLLDRGFVPALGIAVPWTLYVLTLHTVWSIGVPIALVEVCTPARRTDPWLGRTGTVVTAVLLTLGAAITLALSYSSDHFLAPVPALAVVVLVVVALVVIAFRLPDVAHRAGPVPPPWALMILALAAGAVFELGFRLPTWLAVAAILVATGTVAVLTRTWSARPGWSDAHRLALAAGALLTYAWHAFISHPVIAASGTLTMVSHIVFAAGAVALLILARRRVSAAPAKTPDVFDTRAYEAAS